MTGPLRPFLSFYGSKWRAASAYPAPEWPLVVEPFAGSAGYALHQWQREVILVERDPAISSVWRYLLGATADEIRSLPLLDPESSVDDFDICMGARGLIGFWLNGGVSYPRRKPNARMRAWLRGEGVEAGWPGAYWGPAVRERVASQVDRVRHWRLIEGDYSEAPEVEASWFIDPPYRRTGRHYRYGSGRIDYAALAAWCLGRRGQVMVCEGAEATWLPFRPLGRFKGMEGAKTSGSFDEGLWMNEGGAR